MTAVSFTGGKDSVLALHLVSDQGCYRHPLIPALPSPALPPVRLLVTFVPPGGGDGDGAFKAHPLRVVRAVAAALGITLELCEVAAPFLQGYRAHMVRLRQQHGIRALVTGDMRDVAGGFMDAAVAGSGVRLVRPLWGLAARDVLAVLFGLGIRCRVSCVDVGKYARSISSSVGGQEEAACALVPPQQYEARSTQQQQGEGGGRQQQQEQQRWSMANPLHPAEGPPPVVFDAVDCLLGRELTPELVAGPLAEAQRLCGADLAGEGGEYHTLVFACPMMAGAAVALTPRAHVAAGAGGGSGASGHAYVEWEVTPVRP